MRPIVKPKLIDALFAIPPSDLLLQSFGEYCSVSEQPLPSRHFVWHKQLAVEVLSPVPPSQWHDLLLLSENSYLAQLGRQPQTLLYPDDIQNMTFTLDGRSPLRYQLQQATVIVLDEQGTTLSNTDPYLVIVSGENEAANATIDYFALNTQFYDSANSTFIIPQRALRLGFDRRVAQRTHAWKIAAGFADAWQNVSKNRDEQRMLVQQARRLAAATGYWSTWASALLEYQIPTPTIREILLSPPSSWEIGPGPHNPYPGTNPRIA